MHRIRDAGSGKEILKLTMREEDLVKLNGATRSLSVPTERAWPTCLRAGKCKSGT